MPDLAMYMGAKSASGAYQAIIAAMPPHDTYIETHLGTGAVGRAKPPAARSIAIEIDEQTLADYPPGWATDIHIGDCVAFLEQFDFAAAGRTLVYADPPYVGATRSSRRRYRFDYGDDDHRRLIATLRAIPAAVMVSGYPSALYDELLGDWHCLTFQAMTRGGPRTECVWMNFAPGAVHWATYAGKGFTDRQRIKRKAARWRAHYARLSPGERLAVLAALLLEHSQEQL